MRFWNEINQSVCKHIESLSFCPAALCEGVGSARVRGTISVAVFCGVGGFPWPLLRRPRRGLAAGRFPVLCAKHWASWSRVGCVPALRLMCHLRISNNVMSAVFGPKENMHFGQRSLQPGKLRLSCSLGNPGLEPGVVVTRRSVKDHVFSEWEPS